MLSSWPETFAMKTRPRFARKKSWSFWPGTKFGFAKVWVVFGSWNPFPGTCKSLGKAGPSRSTLFHCSNSRQSRSAISGTQKRGKNELGFFNLSFLSPQPKKEGEPELPQKWQKLSSREMDHAQNYSINLALGILSPFFAWQFPKWKNLGSNSILLFPLPERWNFLSKISRQKYLNFSKTNQECL